jgi:hypothetical protein
LIAAKPTPKVMPMKYLPSRVTRSLRGGRHQGRRPKSVGAWLARWRSMRFVLTPDGTGRAPDPFAVAAGGTESGRAGVDSRPSRSREPRDDRGSRDERVDDGPI